MGMGKRPATYTDLEELPPHRVGEIIAGELYASPQVFRLADTNYTLLASYPEDALSRAEPFDALEFTLGILWGR